jgi:hypothetical protein
MVFGSSPDFPGYMYETIAEVTAALGDDIDKDGVAEVAIALSWQLGELVITLSLRGPATLVEQALRRLFLIVDATKMPSEWIEPLSRLIKELAPLSVATNDLTGVYDGALSFEPSDEVPFRMLIPDAIMQPLLSDGFVRSDAPVPRTSSGSDGCAVPD